MELADGVGMGEKNWKTWVRGEMDRIRYGVRDAVRLDRSWNMVWSDPELRTLVLKSTLINLLSLLLLSLFPVFLSPLVSAGNTASRTLAESRTKEIGLWYNILLSWPVFVFCFWVNASWGPDISRRAQTLLHPSYRHQPTSAPSTSTSHSAFNATSTPSDPIAWAWISITRIIMISDFTFLTRLLALIPLFGRPIAFAYMCIINAYYGFEWTFVQRHWPLAYRTAFVQERAGYMLGFGFPATLLTSFGPPLVNMTAFALIYPFFVIQALQSRPPPPSSTSPSAGILNANLNSASASAFSLPPSPSSTSLEDAFFAPPPRSSSSNRIASDDIAARLQNWLMFGTKVPVFFLARHVIEGLKWLEAAFGRDRSGGVGGLRRRSYERSGKRLG